MSKDGEAFRVVDKEMSDKWGKFEKYFVNDSKSFGNKLLRDYESSGKFPVHVLKMVRSVPMKKYDSAICVLRGALPYSIIFEIYGWRIHYIICGRRNEEIVDSGGKLRFNRSIDGSIKQIMNKKVLIIENNSPTGRTPIRAVDELEDAFRIKKPDLFLDYFSFGGKIMPWLKKPFWKNRKRLSRFDRIYEASSLGVGTKERRELLEDFLRRAKDYVAN